MLYVSLHVYGFSEARLIKRESGFGEHMMDYGRDIRDTYLSNKKGILDTTLGAVMTAASVIAEGPDQAYDAILGREYHRPSGIAGRTRRDIGLLLKDVVTLHPLRALGDAWRIATSDLILDGGDALTGNRLSARNRSLIA